MLESLITSSILIVTVLLVRLIFGKRLKAVVRYALWLPVLLRLLMPVPLMQNPLIYEPQETAEVYFDYGEDSVSAVQSPQADEDILTEKSEGISWTDAFSALHITGGVVLAAIFAVSNIMFRNRLKKTASRVDGTESKLPIFKSNALTSACLTGLFSPRIYISASLDEQDCDVNSIIAHEQSHYKHLDHIWSFLKCLSLCIWWFNPLVWIAAREASKDSELACDESVIKSLNDTQRICYGKTLVSMLKTSKNPLNNTVPMLSHSDGIKERIDMIVKRRKISKFAVLAAVLILVTASVFTFTGYANDSKTVVSEIKETTEKISQVTNGADTSAEPTTEACEENEATVEEDTTLPEYEVPMAPISFTVDNTNFKLKSPLNYDTVIISREYREGKSGISLFVPDRQGKTTYVSAAEVAVVKEVVYAGDDADKLNYGNYIVLEHCNGYQTEYRHLDEIFVKEGCAVSAGDKIATMGSTGACTGPCLGFAVKYNGKEINPSTEIF